MRSLRGRPTSAVEGKMSISMAMKRSLFILICALSVLCTGCGSGDSLSESPDFGDPRSAEQAYVDDAQSELQNSYDDIYVVAIPTGTDEYIIVAATILEEPVGDAWSEIRDFEQLVEIGLPGLATDFEWLNGGGPEQIPSSFQFVSGGSVVEEEIYYRNSSTHTLRYQLLTPVLGIQEYDAQISLVSLSQNATLFVVVREVELDPGVIEGLVDLIELETNNVHDYFEGI
jgi:hypothetical protein